MASTVNQPNAGAPPAQEADKRRWWGLVVIALAQLMVVLDATIVNIALPHAQTDLGMSDTNRQWVITAYTLAFGGLLLLGGRLADLIGRKRTFLIGLIGFALASAIGGAAQNSGMLFGARALQGAFAAVLAPSALSLLTTMFTDPKERSKAFGIYGAIAGGGSAIGLLLGGVLTQYLDWRWCLYVNAPIAVIAAVGAIVLLHDHGGHAGVKMDVPGVILGCGGLVALVYGFSEAQPHGWSSPMVLGLLIGGVVLLGIFGIWQRNARNPLLPLHVITERNRGGSMLAMLLATIGMFGVFLFMTYYLQTILDYSALKTGLAFLPMSAAIIIGSTQVSARLLHRVSPRTIMVPGLLMASLGLGLLSMIGVHSNYAEHILPGLLLMGFGLGCVFMPVMATATAGVAPRDAGITSASINTAQQVGGSLGTALLNTIAISATTTYVTSHAAHGMNVPAILAGKVKQLSPPELMLGAQGTVHGYSIAMYWGIATFLLACLAAAIMVNARAPKHSEGQGDDGAAPASTGTSTPAPVDITK